MQLDFSAEMYNDPTMRPHLKKLYDSQYASFYERIDAMPEEPQTISVTRSDGQVVEAHELSAAQYRAAVPTFDKWLELQSRISEGPMADIAAQGMEHARQHLQHIQQHGPDSASGVRTVFSQGDQILGYVNDDGSVVTHSGGNALQSVAKQADALGLTGEAKIAYLQEHGGQALAAFNGAVEVTQYSASEMPTRREFAAAWYPDHDVDGSYQSALVEARSMLENIETMHKQHMARLNEMQAFLLHSMEQEQGEPVRQTEESNPLIPNG